MNVNQNVSLNLTADGIPPRLHMVQGDSNTRTIIASLWDDSQPYNVSASAAVMMRFRKPDGTGGLYDVTEGGAKISVSGNVVTVPVATQLLTVAGVVFAQLDIYGTATGAAAEKLATFRLAIEVAPSVYPNENIISSDYYNILTAKVAEAVAAADRAEQATVHTPTIGSNGNWYVWDQAAGKYVNSGVSAQQGPKGDKGDKGDKGATGERGTGWWETTVSTPQSGAASSMSTFYAAYKVGDFLINPSLGYVYEVTNVTVSGNTSGIQYEYKGTLKGIKGDTGPQGPRGYPSSVNGVTPDKNGNITLLASDVGAAPVDHKHAGRVISPTSIELFPGASVDHGGYIDFHYNSDSADYTSRLIEIPKGVVRYNNYELISTANITAIYNVHVSFVNGVFEYSNSAIKAASVCFAQFRGSAVTSGFQDTVLGVTSYAGKVRIIAKNGGTFETDVNILIINL